MILATEAAHVNRPAVIRAAADFARHAAAEAVANGHDRYDDIFWMAFTITYHETPYDETPIAPAGLTGRDPEAWNDGVHWGQTQHLADIDAWADEFEPKDYQWEDYSHGGCGGHSADESECW